MERFDVDGVSWLEFESLRSIPHLRHGFFLRSGGTSISPYHSLNCGLSTGDDAERVLENRMRVRRALGVGEIASVKQVHGCRIVCEEQCGAEADGISSSRPGSCLMVLSADCQCAFFYDTRLAVIAVVHVGWRGNVANIYSATVLHLAGRYGCHPRDLLVCICPSLGPTKAEFIHYRNELPEHFWAYQRTPDYFDFWKISRAQLEDAGILPDHIEVASLCTYSNAHDFFSYRRDGVTGRHAAIIALY